MKRVFDLALTLILLVALAPVFVCLAGLVRISLGSPILFSQQRPGKGGRVFRMFKFRTMLESRDADGNLLPDEDRLTKVGKLLRATSLDELPELLNVLRGEMSLVGPRPLLVKYLEYYTPEQNRRHEVLPGITGWAQISGRNSLSWEEKFELDVWYVDNRTMVLDLIILFRTVTYVVSRRDISADGHATAPEFTGSSR